MGCYDLILRAMPVLHFIKRFAEVPSTWEGWAMRVLTVAVVLMLGSSWILFSQTETLRAQVQQGRNERNAYQQEQTARTCAILRKLETDSNVLRDNQC